MASFSDCIRSAQQQGAISQEEADALIDRFEQHRQARRAAGDRDVNEAAKNALADELDAISARRKELGALAQAKRDDLKGYAETYRDPGTGKADVFGAFVNKIENFGYGAGTSSFAGTAASKYALAEGKLATLLSEFRRSRPLGRRFNKPGAEDMVRAIWGDGSKPAATAMADAVSGVFEDQRLEFNGLGGNIGKLDGPWLPQDHNPAALLNAGRKSFFQKMSPGEAFENWKADFLPKMDMERVRDPVTGGKLEGQRLEDALRVTFDRITTGGWSDREPSAQPFGLGATVNQRQEHRFWHFKSADDWLAYNRDYGSGDPISAIFKHVKSMSTDIAAMETFGPNPAATLEWMKQVVSSETAKFVTGKPSLYAESALGKAQDFIGYGPKKLQAVYDSVQGGAVASGRIAAFIGDIRNVLSSAQLGSAGVLASFQDPFIDLAGRHLSGIPAGHAMGAILKTFSSETRDVAARAGLGLDEFNHITGKEARYAGVLGGNEWSRWLVERTLNWNALEPMTQARKSLFGIDFMGAVADRRGLSFDELGNEFPAMRRTFEDYGIGAKDWDKIRAVEPNQPAPDSAPLLRPIDVARKNRRLGERYLEVMLQQTERDVPTSTARSKAFATLGFNRGTVGGEIATSFLQYKSFSLSFMALQWQAMMMEARAGSVSGTATAGAAMVARGAAYAGSLALTMTMAGAAALQFKNLANGKDLQAMNPTFWLQALQYGGGLGIMGDFMLSDVNRFGQTQTEAMLGPLFGLMVDVGDKTLRENFAKLIRGEKTNFGRAAVNNVAGRYTPLVASLFYTRAAFRRMFIDQLQYLVDPDAHQHFRQQEQNLHRESGQGYFWRPGETIPARMPEMSSGRR